MKLFFAFALLSLASSQTLYLSINLKNASGDISATHLSLLSQTLPHFLSSAVPSEFQQYVQYIQVIIPFSTYNAATQIATVSLFFPSVPVAAQRTVMSQLSTHIESPSVRALSAILPGYLNCLSCELYSMSVDIAGAPIPTLSPTSAPPVGHIVGLKMLVGGATTAVPDAVVTTFQAALPGILETQVSKILELREDIKDVLKDFVKKVDVSQNLTPAGLWVYASFPSIPAVYIDMYAPLFDKYVVQNTKVHDYVAQYLPTHLGCSTCTLAQFELLDDVAPASLAPTLKPITLQPTTASPNLQPTTPTSKPTTATSTSKPTASPTATPTSKPTAPPTKTPTSKPTASPTKTPTSKPTASPTSKPTASPTATPTSKPTASPTATPTSKPTPSPTLTASPTPSPTLTASPATVVEISYVSTLTPAHAFLVVLVGAAALV